MQKPSSPTTPELDLLVAAEPDLVDRIFDYILADPVMAQALGEIDVQTGARGVRRLKEAVRSEFAGEKVWVNKREKVAATVLRMFNGRNATEVARRLQISRATVYRVIKQAGRAPQ